MLPLAEIEEGHNGRFFVLWWITFEDLFYEPLILWGEFEGDGGVIVVGISVLTKESVAVLEGGGDGSMDRQRTTLSASLPTGRVVEKGWTRRSECRGIERCTHLATSGITLDAIGPAMLLFALI
jgi:hypothetical protein